MEQLLICFTAELHEMHYNPEARLLLQRISAILIFASDFTLFGFRIVGEDLYRVSRDGERVSVKTHCSKQPITCVQCPGERLQTSVLSVASVLYMDGKIEYKGAEYKQVSRYYLQPVCCKT